MSGYKQKTLLMCHNLRNFFYLIFICPVKMINAYRADTKQSCALIFSQAASQLMHFIWGKIKKTNEQSWNDRLCFTVCFAPQVRMLWCLLLILPAHSGAQRSEPMFSAITKTVLPPDYDNNPTQLNYGVAVTDVDGDGDLEIFVAGWGESKKIINGLLMSNPFYK